MTKAGTLILSLASMYAAASAQQPARFPEPQGILGVRATLAGPAEPGTPIILKGTFYHRDGKTPFPGLVVYLFQTDASGDYHRAATGDRLPRLHGWLRTDSGGNYSIRSVKPGPYPGGRIPAHIHVMVRYSDGNSAGVDEFLFDGDPAISEKELKSAGKGLFSNIVKLTPQQEGPLVGRRDIILRDP